jgi:hypothetical protein
MSHYGIDISSNNHPNGVPIDYAAVVADLTGQGGGGQPFAFVKVTESTDYINPYWHADAAGLAAAGAAVGCYVFDHGGADPAAEESKARLVMGPGLPLVVDGEFPQGLTPAQYGAHMLAVIAHEPIRVEYLNQWQVANGELSPFCWLWLADYNPGDPVHAQERIRQESSTAHVKGIVGYTDRNRWTGSEEEFVALFHTGPLPPQPPDPLEAAVLAFPVLSPGSADSHHVRIVQGLLDAQGAALLIDGAFGPLTEAGVIDWQRRHPPLLVDGKPGPQTVATLVS